MNKRRYARLAVVMLVLAIAGLALVGCGGKKATPQTGEILPGKDLASPAGGAQSQPANEPTDVVKIYVNQSGIVRVTDKELRQAGFDPLAHQASQLSLSLGSAAVPFEVKAEALIGNSFSMASRGRAAIVWIMCTGCVGRQMVRRLPPSQ